MIEVFPKTKRKNVHIGTFKENKYQFGVQL